MNQKQNHRIYLVAIGLCMLAGIAVTGCKTGKGCDCPTFGQNETPKVSRF